MVAQGAVVIAFARERLTDGNPAAAIPSALTPLGRLLVLVQPLDVLLKALDPLEKGTNAKPKSRQVSRYHTEPRPGPGTSPSSVLAAFGVVLPVTN